MCLLKLYNHLPLLEKRVLKDLFERQDSGTTGIEIFKVSLPLLSAPLLKQIG